MLLTKYHMGDEVKKTETGKFYSTNGSEEGCVEAYSAEA
jgi:hypothetical protein